MSPKKTSPKRWWIIIILRHKRWWCLKTLPEKGDSHRKLLNCMYPDPNVPLSLEISFCKPYITWLFYGFIIPKNCCREHQLNTMGKTRTVRGIYTHPFPLTKLVVSFPSSRHLQLQWNASYWTSGHSWQLLQAAKDLPTLRSYMNHWILVGW